jgi:hypothetical protein
MLVGECLSAKLEQNFLCPCYKYTCDEVISVTVILILQMLKNNMSKQNYVNKMFTTRILADTNGITLY